MPQPPDYHDFADQRGALGSDNFLDVVSNGAFLVAGLFGLFAVRDAFDAEWADRMR